MTNVQNETWKDVPGYEGLYQISSNGRVKSFAIDKKNGRILKPQLDHKGYPVIGLSLRETYKIKKVHRLVALAFIPNPFNKPQVNHINGIKTDSSIGNLEWATQSENNKHAFANGLNKPNTVPIVQLSLNGDMIREWDSAFRAGVFNNIQPTNITRCARGGIRQAGGYRWEYASIYNTNKHKIK